MATSVLVLATLLYSSGLEKSVESLAIGANSYALKTLVIVTAPGRVLRGRLQLQIIDQRAVSGEAII